MQPLVEKIVSNDNSSLIILKMSAHEGLSRERNKNSAVVFCVPIHWQYNGVWYNSAKLVSCSQSFYLSLNSGYKVYIIERQKKIT